MLYNIYVDDELVIEGVELKKVLEKLKEYMNFNYQVISSNLRIPHNKYEDRTITYNCLFFDEDNGYYTDDIKCVIKKEEEIKTKPVFIEDEELA